MSENVVGRNAVREVLVARRRKVARVLLAEGVAETGPLSAILELCRQQGVPVSRVTRSELDQLGLGVEHQGIVAEVSPYPYVSIEDIATTWRERQESPFVLALDLLQDPQNVGSLLRTAEAVGVHGVILQERRSAQITPAVVRASAGATEHLRIALVVNLVRALEELKTEGLWIVGVEDHPAAQDYRQVNLDIPLALVVGSEGQGMRRLVAEHCDMLMRIPMRGRIHSLNAAIAGSIVLYQVWNARASRPGAEAGATPVGQR